MRMLLVSPESELWSSRKHIPLGLGYLGAVLEEEGDEVQLWDGAVEEEPLSVLLDRERFDLVGVTSTTPLIHEAWEAAREARRRDAITILGGSHPTLLPAESLERPEVDMVARGEAEDTIIEITRALVTSPKFMLLDEPFTGVDPIAVNDIQTQTICPF